MKKGVNLKTLITLASSNKYSGNFKKSIELYEEAVEIDPSDKTLFSSLGLVYNNDGQHEKAIDACAKALAIDPKYEFALNLSGLISSKMENYDKAILMYKRAVAINPSKQVLSNLGNNYYKKGDHKTAIEFIQKSLDLDPKFADLWYTLARALSSEKRYDDALEAINRCLKLDAKHEKAKTFHLILSSKKKVQKRQLENDNKEILL